MAAGVARAQVEAAAGGFDGSNHFPRASAAAEKDT